MPVPSSSSITWWMTLAAVGGIGLIAFLVSWVLTDVLHLPRAAYLAALMAVTAAVTYAYLAWTGTDAWTFISHNWAWGVVGALVSGGIGAGAIMVGAGRRGLPRPGHRSALFLTETLVWEDFLYGAAEGMLLSVLPVLAAWQSFQQLGWTDSAAGAVGSGVLALGASVLVIWVHHLGYREFRGNPDIIMPILACGVLSVAYLLTQSVIAPVGGHFLLHTGISARGLSMPPYSKTLAGEGGEVRPLAA
jgi:hypothetical protein